MIFGEEGSTPTVQKPGTVARDGLGRVRTSRELIRTWLFEIPRDYTVVEKNATSLPPSGASENLIAGCGNQQKLLNATGVGFGAQGFDQFGEGFGAEVSFATVADAYAAGFGFLGTDDEHVGNFLELRVADFGGQLFVAVVEMDADAVVFQCFVDVPGVVHHFFADRADFHLYGREP